jgi:hypothetical protein
VLGQDDFNADFKFIIPLTGITEPVEATPVNAETCG